MGYRKFADLSIRDNGPEGLRPAAERGFCLFRAPGKLAGNLSEMDEKVRLKRQIVPGGSGRGNRHQGGRPHSSGTPALRRPAKYVASNKARIFGTP
jgi:hypothetical protein